VTEDKIITFNKAKNSAKHQGSVMKQKDRKLDALKAAFKASRDEVAQQRKNEASLAQKRKKNKKNEMERKAGDLSQERRHSR